MQCYSPLHIVDLFSSEVVTVNTELFQTPFAFIYLYDRHSFLAFRKTEAVLWNLNGEVLSRFEDHTLWFPAAAEDHTSVIYITEKQDLVRAQQEGARGLGGPWGAGELGHRIHPFYEPFRAPQLAGSVRTGEETRGDKGLKAGKNGPPLSASLSAPVCSSYLACRRPDKAFLTHSAPPPPRADHLAV
jgi:hypothetical protein